MKTCKSVDNWDYARWIYVVGRSLDINPASSDELIAGKIFIDAICQERNWLDISSDISEMITKIGHDFNKTPLQNDEEIKACDEFFKATGDRRFGKLGDVR